MKNYQGLKIESYSRKNDKTKILSYDRTSQTSWIKKGIHGKH